MLPDFSITAEKGKMTGKDDLRESCCDGEKTKKEKGRKEEMNERERRKDGRNMKRERKEDKKKIKNERLRRKGDKKKKSGRRKKIRRIRR